MAAIDDKILSLRPGVRVDLFELDLRRLGGGRLRLTPNKAPIIPPTVLRMRDASTTASVQFNYTQDLPVVAGSRVFLQGYFRRISGAGYPMITLFSADRTQSVSIRVNDNTAQTLVSRGGTMASAFTGGASVAGEYVYFFLRFTCAVDSLLLSINPAHGALSAFGTSAPSALVETDFALLSLHRLQGGTMIPVPLSMDDTLWVRGTNHPASGVPEEVDATAQLHKPPVWAGNAYTPIPIEATGFEKTGTGAFPRPKLRMSNLFSESSALAQEFGDMRGAVFTRRRVYAEHLDNGQNPDPMASYTPEIYRVDRKALQNNILTEWELASAMDQEGVQLPGRQILRDSCHWIYRTWNGTAWEYAEEDGCPYTGAAMYDEFGQPVTNRELDKCSHTLKTGCRRRFGTRSPIPFGAFPMVGRI